MRVQFGNSGAGAVYSLLPDRDIRFDFAKLFEAFAGFGGVLAYFSFCLVYALAGIALFLAHFFAAAYGNAFLLSDSGRNNY